MLEFVAQFNLQFLPQLPLALRLGGSGAVLAWLPPALGAGLTLFLSLLVEALPFLLLGTILSSALWLFVDEAKLLRILPRQPLLGALAGSLMGFLFPACECGNVPVARRLLGQGVPAPVAIGFLLAAPTVNPIVIWSTWTAFRDQPELVVLRVVGSLTIATLVAWVFAAQEDLRPLLNPSLARSMLRSRPAPSPGPSLAFSGFDLPEVSPASESELTGIERAAQERSRLLSGTYWLGQAQEGPVESSLSTMQQVIAAERSPSKLPWRERWQLFLENVARELRELGAVLVLGSAIAAAIQVLAPREWILSLGQGPVSSILAMMALAAVISICSTVDAFFALSFSAAFTSGSLLSFLVFGPIIDLKAIGLMLSIFQPRGVAYLFGLAGLMAFLFGLMANYWSSW